MLDKIAKWPIHPNQLKHLRARHDMKGTEVIRLEKPLIANQTITFKRTMEQRPKCGKGEAKPEAKTVFATINQSRVYRRIYKGLSNQQLKH